MIDIKEEVKKHQIIIVVIPNEQFSEKILYLSKSLAEIGKVLYVCINKPYSSMVETFQKNKIPVDRFFFVDAVTKTVKPFEKHDNVEFVSGPSALTELSLDISNIIDKDKFYSILFDSLSTLLVYENSLMVTKFVHNLTSKFRTIETKAVFTILKGGMSSELIKDLSMFADKIIDFGWSI